MDKEESVAIYKPAHRGRRRSLAPGRHHPGTQETLLKRGQKQARNTGRAHCAPLHLDLTS